MAAELPPKILPLGVDDPVPPKRLKLALLLPDPPNRLSVEPAGLLVSSFLLPLKMEAIGLLAAGEANEKLEIREQREGPISKVQLLENRILRDLNLTSIS